MAKVFDPIKTIKDFRDLWRSDLPEDYSEDEEMTLLEHLTELRNRFITMAVALLIGTVVGTVVATTVLELLKAVKPPDVIIIALTPTESFVVFFQTAFLVGVGLAMPVVAYQVLRFVTPALTRREKRVTFTMLPFTVVFFFSGAVFSYFVTLPFALAFLLNFNTSIAASTPSLSSYFSFCLTILGGMGLAFELPVVLYVLAKLGIVSVRRLSSFRRYWIVVAFVVAAIITPTPDPLNQTMVALPLIVLYEVGILMARVRL